MNFFKPKFWGKNKISFFSILLLPIALLIKFLNFLKRLLTKTHRFSIPIICVGNIYLGGTGKTPLCIEIFSIFSTISLFLGLSLSNSPTNDRLNSLELFTSLVTPSFFR